MITSVGGPAFIPLLEQEIVNAKKWLTAEEFMESLAISNATPGLLATKMATECGFRTRGLIGAFVSAFAIVLPSILIMLCCSLVLTSMKVPHYPFTKLGLSFWLFLASLGDSQRHLVFLLHKGSSGVAAVLRGVRPAGADSFFNRDQPITEIRYAHAWSMKNAI